MEKFTTIVDETTGKCVISDKQFPGMIKRDVTLNIFDGYYYITSMLNNNKEYQAKLFEKYKNEKYQEITTIYDTCCNFGVIPVSIEYKDKELNLFANRAWLGTWNEAMVGMEYTKQKANVRLYEAYGETHVTNITLKDITLEDYKALYLQLISYRFLKLQPLRDELYARLKECTTVEDITKINVDFGILTVDEQNDTKGTIILEKPTTKVGK